jgi:hypothetical protein
MPVIWALVLLAAVVAAAGGFLARGDDGFALQPTGVLFVLPLGAVAAIAIGAMRGTWTRGLALTGAIAALLALVAAAILYGAMAAGAGIGALLSLVGGPGAAGTTPLPLFGVTAIGAIGALVGCLIGAIVGPPADYSASLSAEE